MSQVESTLLQTPLEIRQEIYSYVLPSQVHVCLRNGKFTWSRCQNPGADYRDFYGHNRNYDRDFVSGPLQGYVPKVVRVRRIQSTWGPHWMCEEDLETKNTLDISVFLVCRRVCVVIIYHFACMC
jgi:hypothetical protein